MIWDVALLLVGLALLVKGGDLFVASSVRAAEFLDLPRVVIGSTLVALATSSPELVVSVMSGLQGESGLAVGNAVGSCLCNIGLILGFTAAYKHVETHVRALRTPLLAMSGLAVLLLLWTADLTLQRWQGQVLVVAGLVYFVWDLRQHLRATKPAEVAEAAAIEEEEVAGHPWLRTKGGTAALFACGAVLVIVGSKLLVDSAVSIATAMGVPAMVIGLTVVALGTSLPELVTAVTSARQNVSDLAVGNILGANIANLTFIVGAAAALQEVTLTRRDWLFNLPALLAYIGLLVWMMRSGNGITRREGGVLLAFYALYVAGVVVNTLAAR